METGDRHGLDAAGKADPLDDLGDGADGRVIGPVLRDQHDALVVTDVGGDGDVHAREHDCVLERYEQQLAHCRSFLSSSYE